MSDSIERNPAAARHLVQLLLMVKELEREVIAAGGWYNGPNVFLYGYDEIMAQCPEHARAEVTTALLQIVQRTKLADPRHPPLHGRAPRRDAA